jgi:tryptophan-rich sensory protein
MFSKIKLILISIAIPLLFGVLGSLLGDPASGYVALNNPSFAPPSFVFPIAWTTLYILMGISSYIIYITDNKNKKNAIILYIIQLIVNSLWTYFFFKLKLLLFSFYWIILMIILVAIMLYKFYKIKPIAAYLQIPYILWLIFASILNYSIYLLN